MHRCNQLLGALALAASSQVSAQIYVLENDLGESIIVPPGEKNPEDFIKQKMVGRSGSNWRVTRAFTQKGCLARRSVTAYRKPTRWVVVTRATEGEARMAAIEEARALTGVYTGTPGNFEQGYCNRADAVARDLDVAKIEQEFKSAGN